MRFRLVLALMVAGLLSITSVAAAQDSSSDPTSGYTTTTPSAPAPKPEKTKAQGSEPSKDGEEQSGVAPAVAAQPAGDAPSSLAFTGAEPLVLVLLGLAVAGGAATLLVRDRRRSQR